MEELAPSLPASVSLAACIATLALVVLHAWRLRDACAAFVLFSIWLRYSIAAFHEFTYPPVLGGLSIIATSSIIVTGVGLAVVGTRQLLLRKLIPFYAMMAVILISAALNVAWSGAANSIVKWLYLIVLTLAIFSAMCRLGPDRILRPLTVVFAAPIVLQWISVVLDVKLTNQDGTVCFIGGYQHEQMFSIILLTFLFITCFLQRITLRSAYLRLAIVAVGLALANYRTSLLAGALPAASLAVGSLMSRVVKIQRRLAFVFVAAVAVFVVVGVAQLARDRFADLGTVVQKGASLVQPPEHFTADERRLFSGRAYLWSEYIDAYLQGSITEILFGFGPDSWVGKFPLYAHNTFISDLYEFGIFGTFAFIWIVMSNMLLALRTSSDRKPVLLACHVGFIVLNLATMPMWTIEGDILYALVLAQTWYLVSLRPGIQNTASLGGESSLLALGQAAYSR